MATKRGLKQQPWAHGCYSRPKPTRQLVSPGSPSLLNATVFLLQRWALFPRPPGFPYLQAALEHLDSLEPNCGTPGPHLPLPPKTPQALLLSVRVQTQGPLPPVPTATRALTMMSGAPRSPPLGGH
jgi:hypothetical protein